MNVRASWLSLSLFFCAAAHSAVSAADDKDLLSYVASDCHAAVLIRPANFGDFELRGKPFSLLEAFDEYGQPAGFTKAVATQCELLLVEVWLGAEDSLPEWSFVARFKETYDRSGASSAFVGPSQRLDFMGFKAARGFREKTATAVFVDERTIAVGSYRHLQAMLDKAKKPGAVAKLLSQLDTRRDVRAAADVAALADSLMKSMPPPSADDPMFQFAKATSEIVNSLQSATLEIDLKAPMADAVFVAADETQAAKAAMGFHAFFADMLGNAIEPAKAELEKKREELTPEQIAEVEAGMDAFELIYQGLIPKKEGLKLRCALNDVAHFSAAIALFLPGGAGAYFAGMRVEATGRLQKVAAALERYRAEHGRYPDDIRDPSGKPLLSWRVALLPYLGYGKLYKQFHLNEAWGKSHNMTTAFQVPLVYQHPYSSPSNHANCLRPTGDGTEFATGGASQAQVARGLTLIEARGFDAVIWTKPADLAIDVQQPMAGIQQAMPYGTLAIDGTGKVHLLTPSIPKADLLSLLAGTAAPEAPPAPRNAPK